MSAGDSDNLPSVVFCALGRECKNLSAGGALKCVCVSPMRLAPSTFSTTGCAHAACALCVPFLPNAACPVCRSPVEPHVDTVLTMVCAFFRTPANAASPANSFRAAAVRQTSFTSNHSESASLPSALDDASSDDASSSSGSFNSVASLSDASASAPVSRVPSLSRLPLPPRRTGSYIGGASSGSSPQPPPPPAASGAAPGGAAAGPPPPRQLPVPVARRPAAASSSPVGTPPTASSPLSQSGNSLAQLSSESPPVSRPPPPPRTQGPPPNLSPRASPPRRLASSTTLPTASSLAASASASSVAATNATTTTTTSAASPPSLPPSAPPSATGTLQRGPPPLLAVRKLGEPAGVPGSRRSYNSGDSSNSGGEEGSGETGAPGSPSVPRGRPPITRTDRFVSSSGRMSRSGIGEHAATMRGGQIVDEANELGSSTEDIKGRFAATSAMLESLNLSTRIGKPPPGTQPPPPPPGGPAPPAAASSAATPREASGGSGNESGSFMSSLAGMLKSRRPPEEADPRIQELLHLDDATPVSPRKKGGELPEIDEESAAWCTPRTIVNSWRDLPEDPLVEVKDATDHIEAPALGVAAGDGVSLEFQDEQKRPYREYMYERDHMHMLPAKDNEAMGPIILSLESGKKPTSAFQRGILRTKKGDLRFVMPASTSSKDRLKHLKTVVPDLAALKLVDVKDQALNDALLKYEDQCCVSQYKFGVIVWRDGQSEDELFANNELSGGFELFLAMLGDRIELSGWQGFRGGLDVTGNGTTGTHSVFRRFAHSGEELEIMYHVAPLLPFFEKDLQQLERKRHVGNDVVNVVFLEGTQPMPTGLITSHFTYVFIVVRLESISPARFRVAVCAKDGVRPFGPPLPDPPIFDANQSFSDWMAAKLVNAERASMYAQTFATKMARTRNALLGALSSEFRGKK